MPDTAHHLKITESIAVPTEREAAACVHEARRMFTRTLSCWASDVLTLRRCGAHEMTWPGTTAASPFRHSQVRKAA